MHRHDLFDIWRNNNPKTKRFSFHRGKTKSRIDYIICSNSLSSKLLDSKIKHFPFSDHDICTVKVKLEDIERGPGIWVMNLNTIKSETFISVFNTWWPTWKNQINRFETIQEWWEVTKAKIKCLTIDISKQINKGKNKSNIENLEKKLEHIKLNNDNNTVTNNKIEEIERIINTYYTNRTEAAKIRSRIKWTEEGEKSTRYFFDPEKKRGQDKLWNRIKTSEGHYKYDIDSIINKQEKFYSKLFTSEG